MKNFINATHRWGAVALIAFLFVSSAGADHNGTTPSAKINTGSTAPVNRGDDVKFKAELSRDLAHSVLVLVNWEAPGIVVNPRYWWVNNSGFEFSFPCNLTNKGSHKITIQASTDDTDEATYNAHLSQSGSSLSSIPTAYTVGSPSSATATCN